MNFPLIYFLIIRLFWLFRLSDFADKCNQESVALESVELSEDVSLVQDILKEFVEKTGSVIAQHVLDNWQDERKYFIKVNVLYIVKHVNKGHQKENKNMVFIDKLSLFGRYFILFNQGMVIEVWPFFTVWSLFGGGLSYRFDCIIYILTLSAHTVQIIVLGRFFKAYFTLSCISISNRNSLRLVRLYCNELFLAIIYFFICKSDIWTWFSMSLL